MLTGYSSLSLTVNLLYVISFRGKTPMTSSGSTKTYCTLARKKIVIKDELINIEKVRVKKWLVVNLVVKA